MSSSREKQLKLTRARQTKAKKQLLSVCRRLTDKAEAQILADAINELFWANQFHFLTYTYAK